MTRGTDVTDFKDVYKKKRAVSLEEFPDTIQLTLQKETTGDNVLRYGENPNQSAAIYRLQNRKLAPLTNIRLAKSGKEGLSATNYMDVARALDVLKFFGRSAVAVMKHTIPSGFARQIHDENPDEIYRRARDTDTRSAFGCVTVFNREVDLATAAELLVTSVRGNPMFVECVAATSFTPEALARLEGKENLRVVLYDHLDKIPKFVGDATDGLYDLKGLPTGRMLVQAPYLSSIRGQQDLVLDPLVRTADGRSFVVERDPTPQELSDLLTAWYVNIGTRSNGIVIVKDGVTLAVGSGQQERVGAVEQAVVKAFQKAMDREGKSYDPLKGAKDRHLLGLNPLEGAVVSSDAFFPSSDSIEILGRCGVSAVIQPGGSKNDAKVIEAANKYNMAMPFTLERCFGHF